MRVSAHATSVSTSLCAHLLHKHRIPNRCTRFWQTHSSFLDHAPVPRVGSLHFGLSPNQHRLLVCYSCCPFCGFSPRSSVSTVTQDGKLFADVSGQLKEVVIATAADISKLAYKACASRLIRPFMTVWSLELSCSSRKGCTSLALVAPVRPRQWLSWVLRTSPSCPHLRWPFAGSFLRLPSLLSLTVPLLADLQRATCPLATRRPLLQPLACPQRRCRPPPEISCVRC